MNEFIELTKSLGSTAGIMAVMIVSVWKVCKWLGPQIVEIKTRHLAFVDRIELTQDTLCDRSKEHLRKLEIVEAASVKQTLQAHEIINKLDAIGERLDRHSDAIDVIHSRRALNEAAKERGTQ